MTYAISSLNDVDNVMTFCVYSFMHTCRKDYEIFKDYFNLDNMQIDTWNDICNNSCYSDSIEKSYVIAKNLMDYVSKGEYAGKLKQIENGITSENVNCIKTIMYFMRYIMNSECINELSNGSHSLKVREFVKVDDSDKYYIHFITSNNEYIIMEGNRKIYLKMLENSDKTVNVSIKGNRHCDGRVFNYGIFANFATR